MTKDTYRDLVYERDQGNRDGSDARDGNDIELTLLPATRTSRALLRSLWTSGSMEMLLQHFMQYVCVEMGLHPLRDAVERLNSFGEGRQREYTRVRRHNAEHER